MIFLLIVILFIWLFILQSTVSRLRSRLDELSPARPVSTLPIPRPIPMPGETSIDQAMPVPAHYNFTPQAVSGYENKDDDLTNPLDNFFNWLKEDFMMKLGAGLLLLAFGWFVSYAFANNWIGEFGRIMLGLLLGAGIMVGGVLRVKQYAHQGGVLLVLGSSTVLMTVYAAREIYDMFDPYSAMLLMLATVVLVALVSVKEHRRSLAIASLVLAGIAPLLTASPVPSITDISLYLLVIVGGTLWVVYLRGWSVLTFMSLIIVTFHHLPFLTLGLAKSEAVLVGLWFGFLFTLIFLVASLIGFLINDQPEEHRSRVYTALGSAIYLILWLSLASPEWLTFALTGWALIFAVGGFLTYQLTQNRDPFYIYAGTSLLLLAAALAEELSGPTLTIAYIIKFTLLVYLAQYVLRDETLASRLSFLLIIPAVMSVSSLNPYVWQGGILHSDLVVLLLMLGATLTVGQLLSKTEQYAAEFATSFYSAAAFYAVALVWLVTHAGISDAWSRAYEMATMVALVIYTIAGIGALMIGRHLGRRGLTVGGYVLIGLVVVRLLLVDVWQMQIVGKIITFLVIGVLLMSTAFIIKKPKSSNQ